MLYGLGMGFRSKGLKRKRAGDELYKNHCAPASLNERFHDYGVARAGDTRGSSRVEITFTLSRGILEDYGVPDIDMSRGRHCRTSWAGNWRQRAVFRFQFNICPSRECKKNLM
jgi:hypothetical protein